MPAGDVVLTAAPLRRRPHILFRDFEQLRHEAPAHIDSPLSLRLQRCVMSRRDDPSEASTDEMQPYQWWAVPPHGWPPTAPPLSRIVRHMFAALRTNVG